MAAPHLSWRERLALWVEDLVMTRLVPLDRPGRVSRRLFKLPLLFYRAGVPLFNDLILLLTTVGRKSGKLRATPLEYRRDPRTGEAIITAGWGGRTDWRANLRANPHVLVQIGRRRYEAWAEPLPEAEVAAWIAETLRLNPASTAMFARWAGEPVRPDAPESLLRAAACFPAFRLRPLDSGGRRDC